MNTSHTTAAAAPVAAAPVAAAPVAAAPVAARFPMHGETGVLAALVAEGRTIAAAQAAAAARVSVYREAVAAALIDKSAALPEIVTAIQAAAGPTPRRTANAKVGMGVAANSAGSVGGMDRPQKRSSKVERVTVAPSVSGVAS